MTRSDMRGLHSALSAVEWAWSEGAEAPRSECLAPITRGDVEKILVKPPNHPTITNKTTSAWQTNSCNSLYLNQHPKYKIPGPISGDFPFRSKTLQKPNPETPAKPV